MSSMSVNSLIGKDDESENVKAIPQKRSASSGGSIAEEKAESEPSLQPPFQGQNKRTSIPSVSQLSESIPQHTNTPSLSAYKFPQKQIEDQGLLALLGPNVTSFPFSEETFSNALKLRAEQERTKQEYYRVETANKNLAILQTALRAQMPVNMIPLLCVGNAPELTEEQMKMLIQQATFGTPSVLHPQQQVQQVQQHQQPLHFPTSQQQQQPQQQQQQQPFVGIQPGLSQEQQIQIIQANQKRMQQELQQKGGSFSQGSPFQKSHTRGGSGGGGVGSQQDTFNVNPGPPLGFRFGAGSSTSSVSGRRPLSPAKIGAAAVANLATPTTPYRGSSSTASTSTRRSAAHHRHSSLPLDTSGISHRLSSVTSGPESGESNRGQGLQSPLTGATSTLQVKPIPAQPLHKQSKSQVQPSQESMTSFQHVIQFHHWKPTTGSPTSSSVGGGSPLKSQTSSHKRRKSSPSIPFQEQQILRPTKEKEFYAESTPKVTFENRNKDEVEMDPDLSIDSSVGEVTESKVDDQANPPKAHHRSESNFAKFPQDKESTAK
ncbi:hypothetical protein MEW_01934 [Candida albicans P60002]|nr:hypothetical protein MEW_01934 [Candida albicans P60002]